MVRVLARETKGRGFDSRLSHFQVTTLGKLFHIHVPLSPSSIIWYRSRGGDAMWPCVTDLSGLSVIYLRAHGLDREMSISSPPTLSCGVWPISTFTLPTKRMNKSRCRLGCGVGWTQTMYYVGAWIPQGKGDFFWGGRPFNAASR